MKIPSAEASDPPITTSDDCKNRHTEYLHLRGETKQTGLSCCLIARVIIWRYLSVGLAGGGGQGGGRAHDVLLSLDHRGDVYTYRQWDMTPSTGGAPAGRSLELVT